MMARLFPAGLGSSNQATAAATRPAPFQPAPRLSGGLPGSNSPGALRISQGALLASQRFLSSSRLLPAAKPWQSPVKSVCEALGCCLEREPSPVRALKLLVTASLSPDLIWLKNDVSHITWQQSDPNVVLVT